MYKENLLSMSQGTTQMIENICQMSWMGSSQCGTPSQQSSTILLRTWL